MTGPDCFFFFFVVFGMVGNLFQLVYCNKVLMLFFVFFCLVIPKDDWLILDNKGSNKPVQLSFLSLRLLVSAQVTVVTGIPAMASLVYDDTPNLKMLLGASLDDSYDETLVASLNGGVVSRYSGQDGGWGS